ncbi:MAG: hypothetical protein ACXQTN_04115 [Methanoculleaceae archaeon]
MYREKIIEGDLLESTGVEGRRKRGGKEPDGGEVRDTRSAGHAESSVEGRKASPSPERPKFRKHSDADIFDTSR